MIIKVLGTGCPNCKKLEKAVRQAVEEMAIDAEVEKVEDIVKIMAYRIMRTPALVINEKVVAYGYIPTLNEIKDLIKKSM